MSSYTPERKANCIHAAMCSYTHQRKAVVGRRQMGKAPALGSCWNLSLQQGKVPATERQRDTRLLKIGVYTGA